MRLKYKISVNSIADQNIGIAVGKDALVFKNLLFLNNTGKKILELLNEDISRDSVIQIMQETYDGDKIIVENDTNLFLDKLIEIGLVENDNI